MNRNVVNSKSIQQGRDSADRDMLETNKNITPRLAALSLAIVFAVAGCTPLDIDTKRLPWSRDKDPKFDVPEKMVPMWSDTVLYQPGKAGVRGFGGRIYFYRNDTSDPIKVEGTLTVYAFDATQRNRMPKPERKFVFTAEHLEKHHSKTNLGHSYSVWLPWDEVGGEPRQLSLVAKFEGTQGAVLVTDPAQKLLPGLQADEVPGDIGIEQVSYDATGRNSDGPANESSSHQELTTVTIDVPPSFSRKLKHDNDRTSRRPAEASAASERSAQNSTESSTASEAVVEREELPLAERAAAHFERRKSQVQSQRVSRRSDALPRRQPHRATWQHGLPLTPRSETTTD